MITTIMMIMIMIIIFMMMNLHVLPSVGAAYGGNSVAPRS